MRLLLFILALITGAASILLFMVTLMPGGTDMHLIGSGVFLTAFAVCLGLIGVMVRLEEIRDGKR